VFQPDSATCAQLDNLLALPIRRALRLPQRTPATAVLSEAGLLGAEHIGGQEALRFALRAQTLDAKHPTAELWRDEQRGPERSLAKQWDGPAGGSALQVDARQVGPRLLSHQLNSGWNEDKDPSLPLLALKVGHTGLSAYLRHDDKVTASRRARLRLDRSGLRASLAQRRLAASAACPDCGAGTDDAEHALLLCPRQAAARQVCEAALAACGRALNFGLAMGQVEQLPPRLQQTALAATAGLLKAVDRIAARRQRLA